jgi:hypothetical protein
MASKKYLKSIFIYTSIIIIFLFSCSDSFNTSDTKDKKIKDLTNIYINKIYLYANDLNKTIPTLNDYINSNISNVNNTNIEYINKFIKYKIKEKTSNDIQRVVDIYTYKYIILTNNQQNIEGSTYFENNTLTFIPTKLLKDDNKYTVSINNVAKLFNVKESNAIYNNISRCKKSLTIYNTYPKDTQQLIDTNIKIKIYFNENSCINEEIVNNTFNENKYIFSFHTKPPHKRPNNPTNIQTIFTSSTSIGLKWTKSIGDNNTLNYYIAYKNIDGNFTKEFSFPTNIATLLNLKPSTTYIFRLRARDKEGYFSTYILSQPILTEPSAQHINNNIIYGDENACLGGYPWSTIKHNYPSSESETISDNNSIAIQSFGLETTLYYRELEDKVFSPFDFEISTPDGLVLEDGTYSRERVFNIFANKAFLGTGYYYVKIDKYCYRGIFPKTKSEEDLLQASKDIILVNQ